jgi:amino acid permease
MRTTRPVPLDSRGEAHSADEIGTLGDLNAAARHKERHIAVNGHTSRTLTVRQAASIGVGAIVGAGIFSLLGAAGEVAGAAVWLSFLIAGEIALLQGCSSAKFGARYPSAAGLLIASDASRLVVCVIPTDEDLMGARHTRAV